MDRFSFLNAAHAQFFAQLYDQYLENPDSVEPSWRGFFQGFDFGMTTYNAENSNVEFPILFFRKCLSVLKFYFWKNNLRKAKCKKSTPAPPTTPPIRPRRHFWDYC